MAAPSSLLPYLEAGGTVAEWGTTLAACVATLVALDFGLCRPLCGPGRWFALHALTNMIIVAFCLPELARLWPDPVVGLVQSTAVLSRVPLAMNLAVHTYHVVLWLEEMQWIDWLHHGLMTFVAIPACLACNMGPVVNLMHFFVLGLPGGIDYALLSLVKMQRLSPLREKSLNCTLNLWLRSPGIVMCTTLGYLQLCFVRTLYAMPVLELGCRALLLTLFPWNCQFFLDRVIRSHERHLVKGKASK